MKTNSRTCAFGDPLTRREIAVRDELCTGDTNKIIARRLGISHRTVECYRHRIFVKTGARNVVQLVRLVLTQQLGRAA